MLKSNVPELERLAKNFYEITNTLITIYDENQNWLCAWPNEMSRFCDMVRTAPELAGACRSCDVLALETCRKTRKTQIYRCHMGLIEVATPIVCRERIIGYLLFGQILPENPPPDLEQNIRSRAAAFSLDAEALLQRLPELRTRSNAYIHAISELLEMCANHIWQTSIMSVDSQGLAARIDGYIRENLTHELALQEICGVFNISRGTLYNLSRKNFGCGITEYISHCRVSEAKRLLREADDAVSAVAEQVGIPDANYFTRFFKKHTGQTPLQYRARHK